MAVPDPPTTIPPVIPASNSGSSELKPVAPSGPMIVKKMRPGNIKNGRNLCAHQWLKQTNLSGSSAEFKMYWDCSSAEQILKYGAECAQLIADGMWMHCNAMNIAKLSATKNYGNLAMPFQYTSVDSISTYLGRIKGSVFRGRTSKTDDNQAIDEECSKIESEDRHLSCEA
ncbi:hypothetical protein EDD22DRAFT_850535 [Suillus occidentalis]|nr:hypothetical protein EDD22DRAFT_850535 [Suillus occidentalis]